MQQHVDLITKAVREMGTRTSLEEDRVFYSQGDFDEPYSPPGLEAYSELRSVSGNPLIRLAVRTISRRLKVQGLHTDPKAPADPSLMRILRKRKWASLQAQVWRSAMIHEVGVVSVWPNSEDMSLPYISVEDVQSLKLGWSTRNQSQLDYVIKHEVVRKPDPATQDPGLERAYYWVNELVQVYEREARAEAVWSFVDEVENYMGRLPFVIFVVDHDDRGKPINYIDPLIPIVKSIDALRYFLLLAAQFAAYRQRIGTGIDPIVRDRDGNPVFKIKRDGGGVPILSEDGEEILELDENDMPIPVMQRPGKVGVDRMLVFPGENTKVYDLQESDLKNYIITLQYWEGSFSANSHVPSQYLAIGDWSNVAGDTMEANEGALRTFVADLQTMFSDGMRDLADLINLARGIEEQEIEVVWRNMEPKSLTQVAMAASQMVPQGAPMRMFLEMLATSEYDVSRWMNYSEDTAMRALQGDVAQGFGMKVVPNDEQVG